MDVVKLLDAATHSQAKKLFRNFYPQYFDNEFEENEEVDHVSTDLDVHFANAVGNTAMASPPSMAELQGYLMDFKNSPEDAIEGLDKLSDAIGARAELKSKQEQESRRLSAIAGFREDTEGSQNRRLQKKRNLSATDVDRMVFNPQPGWEEQCGIKKE